MPALAVFALLSVVTTRVVRTVVVSFSMVCVGREEDLDAPVFIVFLATNEWGHYNEQPSSSLKEGRDYNSRGGSNGLISLRKRCSHALYHLVK